MNLAPNKHTPKALAHWLDCYEHISKPRTDMQSDVLAFMELAAQVPRARELAPLALEDMVLAHKLMTEEIREMWEGFHKCTQAATLENLTEFADGAIDTIYVILWTMAKFNLPTAALWAEVQRSNMAKDRGDGKMNRNEFGKVQKPPGWTPPNLFAVIAEHYDQAKWQGGVQVHAPQEGSSDGHGS